MKKTLSISEEYEAFLRRVVSVLGQETLYEGITNEMIKGAWDVTTHIHPVDGSFRY
jgi:hypothetical protein